MLILNKINLMEIIILECVQSKMIETYSSISQGSTRCFRTSAAGVVAAGVVAEGVVASFTPTGLSSWDPASAVQRLLAKKVKSR